ncbi:MAG: Sec-independent protein translocase protein TatB [Xanthobacteraceae bacterium]
MFDISWTEFLLIGVVALIVIGPKELPGVMRTLGQYTRKARSMAADFQNQFQEAMREAEMADLKKQVDDMASDIKNYDPLKEVRSDFDSMGKDFEKSLAEPSAQQAADPSPGPAPSPEQPEQLPLALTPEAAAPALPAPEAAAAALPAPEAVPALPQPDVETSVLPPPDTAALAAPESAAPEPAAPIAAPEPAAPIAEPAATERS